MALDFGEYIIAFLSLDLVFKVSYNYFNSAFINSVQPIWARSREDLPAQHIDVYQDYCAFLEQVTAWADQKLSSPRDGFAINAIRKACKIFGGVGVYTVLELFFRAGESEFIKIWCPHHFNIQDSRLFCPRQKFLMFLLGLLASARHITLMLQKVMSVCGKYCLYFQDVL